MTFDGEKFKVQYGCLTFRPRRPSRDFPRKELVYAQKNRWVDDWCKYWFYATVPEFFGDKDVTEPSYPLASRLQDLDPIYLPDFRCGKLYKPCTEVFEKTIKVSSGRDIVEEYIAAAVHPLSQK